MLSKWATIKYEIFALFPDVVEAKIAFAFNLYARSVADFAIAVAILYSFAFISCGNFRSFSTSFCSFV